MYYDKAGNKISMEEASQLHTNKEYVQVRYTDLGELGNVSTVWLGLDHRWIWIGDAPLIFETMIFDGPHNDWQERYFTEAEAIQGHRRIVYNLRNGKDPAEFIDLPDANLQRDPKW